MGPETFREIEGLGEEGINRSLSGPRSKSVVFVDEHTRDAFLELKAGKFEEKQLAIFIERAIKDLKGDPLAGVIVPKRLWPKEYLSKFDINNLRKYNLPNGWRLTYTLRGNKIEIVS